MLVAWIFEAGQEMPDAIWMRGQSPCLRPRHLCGKQDIVADLFLSLKSPLATPTASTLREQVTAQEDLANALLAVASCGSYYGEAQNA